MSKPEERRLDGSTRSSKPLHIGSSFQGHQVHIQVLIQVQALDAASQVMRVDDAQGLLLQGDVLLVEQDAALKGPGGHEAEGMAHKEGPIGRRPEGCGNNEWRR